MIQPVADSTNGLERVGHGGTTTLAVPGASGEGSGLARARTAEGGESIRSEFAYSRSLSLFPALAGSDRVQSTGGGTASFLSRFVSSFRGAPLPGSSERPTLSRSTSSPLVTLARPRAARASVGSLQPVSPASSSTLRSKRFPFRRTTSGSPVPSPMTSPALSNTHSVSSHLSSEPAPSEWSSHNGEPICTTHGTSTPQDSKATEDIAPPVLPPLLENPLLLVATLLPPALLLLSNLGPAHLFSPPLVLPSFDTLLASPVSAASNLPSEPSSEPSPDHSRDSSFSLLPPARPLFAEPPHAYSHELHAPSTISVPAVSAAAIWTIFRGLEWIGQVGTSDIDPSASTRTPTGDENDAEGVFDFPALLQGVADVLAADAATRGVELVIGRIGVDSAPSPVTTPPVDDVTNSKGKGKENVTRELLVRADERAWAVALIWVNISAPARCAVADTALYCRFSIIFSRMPNRERRSKHVSELLPPVLQPLPRLSSTTHKRPRCRHAKVYNNGGPFPSRSSGPTSPGETSLRQASRYYRYRRLTPASRDPSSPTSISLSHQSRRTSRDRSSGI